MTTDATRADLLAAFGVTEEQVAVLNEASGYRAAREQAAREQEAFLEWAERRRREIEADLAGRAEPRRGRTPTPTPTTSGSDGEAKPTG